MEIDILGKVNEKRLAYSNTLLPLFEAIVNSIQAIEERNANEKGIIEISLKRSNQKVMNLEGENLLSPIVDFAIKDNGIGFTDANYESFNFAHSTYKQNKGGKGIGRFIWLRAFSKVEIQSRYFENEKWKQRKFNFEQTKKGIENYSLQNLNGEEKGRSTIVTLKGLKEDFQKWCNSNSEGIAFRIIEHCFVYFLNDKCPIIIIKDDNDETIVNDLFKSFTGGQVKQETIKLHDQEFNLNIVRIYGGRLDNKIHYCANTREVQSERLSIEIPELDTNITDENGNKYSIAVYVSGEFLDQRVNDERTVISFSPSNEEILDFFSEVSQEELRKSICEVIRAEFLEPIEKLSTAHLETIRKFVQDHPRYKQLLKYRSDAIKRVPSGLSPDKMEVELFKIQQNLELEVKEEANQILKFIDSSDDQEEFKAKYANLYDKIIEVGNSKLSEYIIHRKLVLELLEKHIKKSNEGKFSTEDIIHKLVFPLQALSDDLGFEDHNLWIIDERLSYHKYLSSDKKFKKIEILKSQSDNRPDIIIFNKPFAFTNNDKPYSSIVLIEFKRPMRKDYNDDENPILQINKYAREILNNEVTDKVNRPFDLRPGTPIYAYIICDLTPNLRKYAQDGGFTVMPDNNGYFTFNNNYNLYVEIISFDKLIGDSKQRNKILFDKLSIPSD